MRHHARLQTLLPALAALVAGCGGATGEVIADGGASASSSSSSSSSSGGASSSSSTSSSSSGGVQPVFEEDVCAGNEYERTEGLTGAAPADFFSLRDESESPSAEVFVVSESGTSCKTGPDATKCAADLAALRSAKGWTPTSFGLQPPRHRYLVTTTADKIATAVTVDEAAALLAPIETTREGAFLATVTDQYRIVCDGTPNAKKTAAGIEVKVESGTDCGAGNKIERHTVVVASNGTLTVKDTVLVKAGDPGCVFGRRPEGLLAAPAGSSAHPIGAFFAAAAHLEAASVVSFERLGRELEALGAPDDLVTAARASREDEVRHARMTAKAARRFGADAPAARVAPLVPRDAFAVALENATEGCVRETYAALVAHHQARAAADDSIRCMMQVIAEDETRHAALAWDVARWLEARLTADERELVDEARRRTVAALRAELAVEPHEDLAARAGVPDARAAIALLDGLDARFFAA